MSDAGCTDVNYMDVQYYPVINGFKYCEKRDSSYTFLTMLKPTKKLDKAGNLIDYQCNDSKMSKLCGDKTMPFNRVSCIPASSNCPVTRVEFDLNNSTKVNLHTEPSSGPPLVELKLSEGGPPCFRERAFINAQ